MIFDCQIWFPKEVRRVYPVKMMFGLPWLRRTKLSYQIWILACLHRPKSTRDVIQSLDQIFGHPRVNKAIYTYYRSINIYYRSKDLLTFSLHSCSTFCIPFLSYPAKKIIISSVTSLKPASFIQLFLLLKLILILKNNIFALN